ncbi:hypothetical protein OIE66_02960 [Nonomuraea sp. NBC_01738]|uniref:hypothetical protein n=1 Tax=Nonomuraea sp. NBC_01738 TaxID=2976003 RepID=UPI002E0FB273|nr:hypothetical protein OIE66_02960 [Nonomuraea sp. NBC_01738]
MSDETEVDIVAERLRLGAGFRQDERPDIVRHFESLSRRLRNFAVDSVDLDLSVRDRDTADQKITLELLVPGSNQFVASSTEPEMRDALTDVREDMIRQIDDAKEKRDPQKNRRLRETIRKIP